MINEKVKILVLMAVHNGELFIKDQINSIFSQINVDVTILINFDDNIDNSPKIVKKLNKTYKKIFINKFGFFGSPAKNFIDLILCSNPKDYDYVALSDQDDVWKKNKLYDSIKKLNDGYDCYSSNVNVWDYINNKSFKLDKDNRITSFDFLTESAGPGSTYVFNKDSFMKIKKIIKNNNSMLHYPIAHDQLLYSIARVINMKWFFDNEANIYYRQHKNNFLGSGSFSLKNMTKRFRMIFSLEWKLILENNMFFITHINKRVSIFVDEKKNINYLEMIKKYKKLRRGKNKPYLLLVVFTYYYLTSFFFK